MQRTTGEVPMDRGTAKDRSRTRRHRALVACALVLLALPGAAGCGESGEDEAAARRRAAAAARLRAELAVGRRVYARHCQSCHTLAGEPYDGPIIEFEAPNLDEVRLKRPYVEWRIEYGGPAMASFSREIPEHGVRALITYVTETAGRNVVDGDPPPAQLAEGKEVFAQNCAACHAIDGREMTGRPVYYGMDFNLIKPSAGYVEDIVREGIGPVEQMPPFRGRLSGAQIAAVAAYVNAVAAEGPEAPRTPFEDLYGAE
jgi:ubiquinol-cytochrome c reductase cytochrome c subunit